MYQQVNFYRTEFITRKQRFGSGALLVVSGIIVAAMIAAYLFGTYQMMGIKSQLKAAKGQESAAQERLENFDPNRGVSEEDSWSQRLQAAKRALQDQELVLTMVADSSLGEIEGFSRHLTSLARQDTDGLWLSRIRLTALGDNTQIEGQAIRPDLVPLYLQSLAIEEPFADQRFHQFTIDRPEEEEGGAKKASGNVVVFSLSSESTMVAEMGDAQ
jgi:hypothetical protein